MRDALVWKKIGPLANIPVRGSRRLCFGAGGKPIAVFRTGEDKVFALVDECPHKQGPLSEGIVSGNSVACPLHNWVIGLDTGLAAEPDEGRTETIPVKLVDGEVYVGLLVERPTLERPSLERKCG
jgi:nitrite reductase (NADH) small subunit